MSAALVAIGMVAALIGNGAPGGGHLTARAAPTTIADSILNYTYVVGYATLEIPGQRLHVRTGDTVTWTNRDSVNHDITSDDMFCDATSCAPFYRYLKAGETASFTFSRVGYFKYHCEQHPESSGMYGLVSVDDAAPLNALSGTRQPRQPRHL